MIHDPHLGVGARGDRNRLKAHRDGTDMLQVALADREDLESVVGRVDGKKMPAVGGERERANQTAFEQRERGFGGRGQASDSAYERDPDYCPWTKLLMENDGDHHVPLRTAEMAPSLEEKTFLSRGPTLPNSARPAPQPAQPHWA